MKSATLFSFIALGVTSTLAAPSSTELVDRSFCNSEGAACAELKRAVDNFARSVTAGGPDALDTRDESDDAYFAKRALAGLATVVASTQHDPRGFYDSLEIREPNPQKNCHIVGMPCWKAKREPSPKNCHVVGMPCWKVKREPEPSPKNCHIVGMPCWKARSAARSIVDTLEAAGGEKRDNSEVEARCYAPGGACSVARRDLHAVYNAAREVMNSFPEPL